MIDLTPLEVRKKKGDFKKTMRGYDPALVDDFLDLVADRLDQLVRENNSMTERLTRLEHQMGEHRDRERALTDALVTAQEMREEMRQQTARESELMRRDAEQESKQVRAAADQEAKQIRSDAMQAREREEEVLRRLRARQQQLLQSYRTFLAREMAELQVIGETLEIEGMSATTFPAPMQREVEDYAPADGPAIAPAATAPTKPTRKAAPAAPAAPVAPPVARAEPFVAPVAAVAAEEATTPLSSRAPDLLDMNTLDMNTLDMNAFDAPARAAEPHVDDPASMRMLDEPMEMDMQTDLLDHATVMGALEVAILEDDEPFAPEPVDEWDDEDADDAAIDEDGSADGSEDDEIDAADVDAMELAHAEDDFVHHADAPPSSHAAANAPEPEIGAPDHDATVLLENAMKAGYRVQLDDDDDDDIEELLLEDTADDAEDGDGEPPRGWLDKMIDDEERQ